MGAFGELPSGESERGIHGVASLGNGTTITCEMRLVANPFPTRCIRQYNLGGVLAISQAVRSGISGRVN